MPGKISGRKAEQKVVEFTQASGVHRPSSDGDKILTQESTCNMLPVSSQNTCNPAYRDAKIRAENCMAFEKRNGNLSLHAHYVLLE